MNLYERDFTHLNEKERKAWEQYKVWKQGDESGFRSVAEDPVPGVRYH